MTGVDEKFVVPGFQNLYIHVPFCLKKCDYCAFYSCDKWSSQDIRQWLDKLKVQILQNKMRLQHLHTIYIGGGTPSVLSASMLDEFLSFVVSNTVFENNPSVSMEANPDTLSKEKVSVFKNFVTRMSIGVQSFHKDLLQILGRYTGAPDMVKRAVDTVHSAGIENVGLDLIYAVPGQTIHQWECDIRTALSLAPKHISAYSLTLEEGSALAVRGNVRLPDDELTCDMRDTAEQILSENGLQRYEISNYASKKWESEHNQNVWHGESYLGLGPSASSYDGKIRWTETPSLDGWLNGAAPEKDILPLEDRLKEIFIMGLRTVRGWDWNEFRQAVHNENGWNILLPKLKILENEKLAEILPDHVNLTPRGLELWNSAAEFLL